MNKVCTFAFLITALVVVSGCSFGNDRSDCDGSPNVVNAFPDTLTLILRTESYDFALEDPQMPVFEHTGGKFLSFRALSTDENVVTERLIETNILQLTTVGLGIAELSVGALDDCEFSDGDGFFVRVVDS